LAGIRGISQVLMAHTHTPPGYVTLRPHTAPLNPTCALIAGKIRIIGTKQKENARIVDPCEKLLSIHR
jgi:hypothetical protein